MTIVTLESLLWAVESDAFGFVAVILTIVLVTITYEIPRDAGTVSTLKSVRITAGVVLSITF